MLANKRPRPTYATVVSTIALFLAVGGTASAGVHAWITGDDIRDHSVPGWKLVDGTVSGAAIRSGSLRVGEFNRADLRRLRGPKGMRGAKGTRGPRGAQGTPSTPGAQGPVGAQGPAGAPGSSDIVRLFWTAPDITNYQNDDPIITHDVPAAGNYVLLARITATNTGGSGDNLGCGIKADGGRVIAGASASLNAGETKEVDAPGLGAVDDPTQPLVLFCEGGGSTTFDLANVRLSVIKLA